MIFFSFFLWKSLKFFSVSDLLFRGLTYFLEFSSFRLLKRKQTPLWNNKIVKVTKNVIDFVSNVNFDFQIS